MNLPFPHTCYLTFVFFTGNIDQKQYTDRIKAIIEFLGPHLSTDDLSKIWSMQSRHAIQVRRN